MVYKFGGSSVRDAERMREVADIICSFPQYLPCVVLSAMGKVRSIKGDSHSWMGRCWTCSGMMFVTRACVQQRQG